MVVKELKMIILINYSGLGDTFLAQAMIYKTLPLYGSHTVCMGSPLQSQDTQYDAFQSVYINKETCNEINIKFLITLIKSKNLPKE